MRMQLLLILVGVIVALQISSTWLQYVAQKEYMQNELQERASYIRDGLTDKANVLLNNIARETEESIAAFDFFGITRTLQQIVQPEAELQLEYAILMDASRMVYVHTKRPDLQNTVLNNKEDLFAAGVTETTVRESRMIFSLAGNVRSALSEVRNPLPCCNSPSVTKSSPNRLNLANNSRVSWGMPA